MTKTEYMNTINEKLTAAEGLCADLRKLRVLKKLDEIEAIEAGTAPAPAPKKQAAKKPTAKKPVKAKTEQASKEPQAAATPAA
ncbi:hypothetical protein QUW63_13975 [Pseudoflavonifractor phocaeensis]|uniref:hypothetical protein n=1 Tax=Pseudoflavonifractor phocaeensis TaxID=1870988 RepID=UPI0025A3596D|nr:hypothetical protein [Pseudoflavonifractor phocaeensis]MDM8240193.1 hypothetical protein [Pseudoflavonifractor phocaeensis]